jgi:diguanylate cyclase (GGDEF)-like protein/PAS domain S-box-containing protein
VPSSIDASLSFDAGRSRAPATRKGKSFLTREFITGAVALQQIAKGLAITFASETGGRPGGRDEALMRPASEHRVPGDTARAQLRVVDALVAVDGSDAAFMMLFGALRAVVAFDDAMVLQDGNEAVSCIAAEPPDFVGRQWAPALLFDEILAGRIATIGAAEPEGDRAQLPADLVAADEPALLFPVALADRAAVLLLRRAAGGGDFGDGDLLLARQWAIIALALLAARKGAALTGEAERLRGLLDAARQSEQQTAQDRDLLMAIIDRLPIGLTVQDEDGAFILVNSIAAASLGTARDALIGSTPGDFLTPDEAAQRRQWELDMVGSGEPVSTEECHADADGERTWLTTHKPVQIHGRTLLMSSTSDITDRKQIENELARRAYFDDLTGLPTRTLLEQQVEQALARDGDPRFALAFLDLDNFKHINDYYSHAIGDALLVKVAERIRKCLRDTDSVARISGDEFLLLIAPVDGEEHVRGIVGQLLESLKQPFHVDAFELYTSASIGVSLYPDHGTTFEALRRNADNAMYRAKSGGKGEAIYFDAKMGQTITARMELEQRLRLAIRDRKFCCAFQPKVELHSQEVVGFETLVRWRDDDGEIQPPSAFIGLAIELGLIDPITHFVLEEAVRSIESLDQAFGAGTTISLNVAAKQAGDLNFMSSFLEALNASRFARRIMLELTEDAFLAKGPFQSHVLPMVRELGVRVSIDDFGTGYSSLSVLADITADELKVDRSFITGIHQRPRSQSVLRTIESLGHSLGMTIVAEGIETFEELAYLQAATRIRQGQGYYFAKPFFIDDLKDARAMDSSRMAEAARPQLERRRLQVGRGA